jgi:hypothetical protein
VQRRVAHAQVGDGSRRPASRRFLDDVGAHEPKGGQQPGAARIDRRRTRAPGRTRTIEAATRKKAAEEKSAGTSTSVARRRAALQMASSPSMRTGQPKAASMRSV